MTEWQKKFEDWCADNAISPDAKVVLEEIINEARDTAVKNGSFFESSYEFQTTRRRL